MHIIRTITISLIALALLVTGTGLLTPAPVLVTAQEGEEAPRTILNGLDLSTPETALQTILDAFANHQFDLVFWTLAPDQQDLYNQTIIRLEISEGLRTVSNTPEDEELATILDAVVVGGEAIHASGVLWYPFDATMNYSALEGTLPIDLRGKVELGDPQPTALDSTGNDFAYEDAVEIPLTVDGTEGFRAVMVRKVTGDWALRYVIAPGAEVDLEETRIFATGGEVLPPSPNATPPAPGTVRTYYQSIATGDPTAAVNRFVQAWGQQDFLSAWLLLSPAMQAAFLRSTSQIFAQSFRLDAPADATWFDAAGDPTVLQEEGMPFANPAFLPYGLAAYSQIFDGVMLSAAQNNWLTMPLSADAVELNPASRTEVALENVSTSLVFTEVDTAFDFTFSLNGEDGYVVRVVTLPGYSDVRIQRIFAPGATDADRGRGLFVLPASD